MFCDEVTVHFIAGKGGDGCVGFRREKFIPRGGPDGGDGGKGGSVYLVANENVNTLAEFNSHKIFRAKPGDHGFGQKMGGKDAEDLELPVPVGTMIFTENKEKMLGDLQRHGDKFLVARGGKAGFGNAHFKSSTRQTPTFAEMGEPGEERKCTLELKLVADVGIIGLPSVGKSTLLSRISNARPKIAAYHFTTIVPNLGLVTLSEFGGTLQQSFLACDLPGLIEGASQGKGLGIQFLKHVVRNRVLVHLLDVNSPDPAQDFTTIMKEMKTFDKTLAKKPMIIAFNKTDSVSEEDLKKIMSEFKKKAKIRKKILQISCVKGDGLKELVFAIWNLLEEQKAEERAGQEPHEEEDFKIFRPDLETDPHSYHVKQMKTMKGKRMFEVTGRRLEQIVVMTDFSNPEAVARIYDVMEKMSVNKELRRHGAKFGDEIIIARNTIIYRWE